MIQCILEKATVMKTHWNFVLYAEYGNRCVLIPTFKLKEKKYRPQQGLWLECKWWHDQEVVENRIFFHWILLHSIKEVASIKYQLTVVVMS